jgi:protein-tyrosine phosphatase
MTIIPLDIDERLYLSPMVEDWQPVHEAGITAVFDLDGGLDDGVPTTPDGIMYVYFPFNDSQLPNLSRLHALGRLGASLIQSGHRVLSHCGLGFNRSALVAGVILKHMGVAGPIAVEQIRARRPGALYNPVFADYLLAGAPE